MAACIYGPIDWTDMQTSLAGGHTAHVMAHIYGVAPIILYGGSRTVADES